MWFRHSIIQRTFLLTSLFLGLGQNHSDTLLRGRAR
jgi:hypothetical protein